ncbi:TolC family protein [Aureibaculum luteum]|uniref:TolC family protein n=1 Tax=Aureibaculum luteum TaxID=1548456 RepID=UPI000E49F8DE|nr:TolC family protein [Aureibaculum luteum]
MQKILTLLLFLCFSIGFSQQKDTVLTLEELLGYVKKYHPIVKQAQLLISDSEAKLLKARGAFDPKIEVDYSSKKFKGTGYYNKLNSSFKIPTWYGVDLKANYENNDGTYLNSEFKTPDDGLYSVGVSLSLAKGLLTNKRMATLKKAKLYLKQASLKQQLVVNDIIYNSITTYFNWLKNYKANVVYADFLINAEIRFENVKKSYSAGDKPAVDTLEASINLKNRMLDYEKSIIGYKKSTLELSNYLWLQNNVPLELESSIYPDIFMIDKIDIVLNSSLLNSTENLIEQHPKLQELQVKKEILTVDKRLKSNNLLPKIDLEYNFLTTDYNSIDGLNTTNYKNGLSVSFPLFLRKERADLRLTKIKLQDVQFDISAATVVVNNKVKATLMEIESYKKQHDLLLAIVVDYKKLVKSEQRMFSLGESSLFLVNYREVKFIESQLKSIDTEYKLFNGKSNLLKVLNLF